MTPRIFQFSLSAACVLAFLVVPAQPATAASRSGSDSRPVSSRVFAATSPFYQKLPARTPSAPDSPALITSLDSQAHTFYATKPDATIDINTFHYAPPLYVAYASDPVHDIKGWNCQHKWNGWDSELNRQLKGVHIPADMQPDPSSDGAVSIYNADTKEVVDLWRARKVAGQWQACWGGRITDTARASGTFPSGYGASASGLSVWGGTIRSAELLNGRIDHVVSLAIPYTKRATISWPANRSDGNKAGTELAIGQLLRLPAELDLSAMKLAPVALTIARAAQQYGVRITDTSGSVAFSAENPIGLVRNQYGTVFRDRWGSQEMRGNKGKGEVAFPLDKLVALPLHYRVPQGSTPTTPTTPNTAYAAAVKAAKPAITWRLNDTGSTAADASAHKRVGRMRGVTRGVPGAIAGNAAIRTSGSSSSGVYQSAKSKPAKAFSAQVWFKTTTNAGGKILGFENTKVGKGSRADRSLYLTTGGNLVFGTHSGVRSKVVSPGGYNDGAWHQATATQGRGGTRLYVDGALVSRNVTTGAQAGSGYWRLGGGNLDGWPLKPGSPYFAGYLDEFAYYGVALSEATVRAQYRAAS